MDLTAKTLDILRHGFRILFLLLLPIIGWAERIWSGDYETGDYTQWHFKSDPSFPLFNGIPAYGRPVAPVPNHTSAPDSYYGNGDLMGLVTGPVRQGRYANRLTVKNSKNGRVPDDCDNGNCTRRHTYLNAHLVVGDDGVTLPYMGERWISISHYLPADWDAQNGEGWGPTVFELKSPETNDISPTFAISVKNWGWQIYHRWSDAVNPNTRTDDVLPWQYEMFYDARYPTKDKWPDGLADFPETESQSALADLNIGGWTDWVIRVKFDARGSANGGTGLLTVWKRAGLGDWIKVLHITPKKITRGGLTFDHGIGYNVPRSGFGPLAGLYMDLDQVWNLPNNRVIYNDNIKIGDANTSFSEMSPDGSSPGSVVQQKRPLPPVMITEQ
jgi:hypothetical protein